MMETTLAPILLFVYKRLDTLKKTLESLQSNFLAEESELYIFSDAAKYSNDDIIVKEVRTFLRTINGFKRVYIIEAKKNKGLADSIIDGVSKILESYQNVIVLEDDLVVSVNFISYMNSALKYYKNYNSVFSISGFTTPIRMPISYAYDNYFTKRSSSWGWATWSDRWENIDWVIKDYSKFSSNYKNRNRFNKMGSDLATMLKKQIKGKINSWAIRWCYHQYKIDGYTVYPTISKVCNIGFNESGTHTTNHFNPFKVEIDITNKRNFNFSSEVILNRIFLKQFLRPYSLGSRILYKLLNGFSFMSKLKIVPLK
jgi:hypothetical protein